MNFPFSEDIILENEAALLRPLQIADVEHLLQVATEDKDLLQFSPAQIYSEELLKKYIERSIADRQNGMRYSFSIFDKRKRSYAGSSSFLNIANVDSRLEIGATWIGNTFQKTGLNRSCKFLLLDFAFTRLGAARVELKTDERNLASRQAIEKTGAQYEGTLRSHMLMPDGYRRNTACYSILKEEWAGLKVNFLRTV